MQLPIVSLSLYLIITTILLSRIAFATDPLQLNWDDLIPEQYRPSKILERHGVKFLDLSVAADKIIYEEMLAAQEKAPVNQSLDSRQVKLSGYVVPLEGDGKALSEFLLVPEYGSCIHVPPPPRNQMVYIFAPPDGPKLRLFDSIIVEGEMRTGAMGTKYGDAGYRIRANKITEVRQ